jgi:hypothetical protein
MTLTERERQFIQALAAKIRVLTFQQICGAWWPDSDSGRTNARRRLGELTRHGLLIRTRVHARPLLPLTEPLCRWKPGEPEPNFGALAWQLHARWQEPLRTMTAYLGTKRAAGIFGGVADGRIKNPSQASHDIHLSGVYLHFLRAAPTLAAGWVGEDVLAPSREGQKLPDAILHDAEGRPRLAIEFGGSYQAVRIAEFHADCAARTLPPSKNKDARTSSVVR